MLAKIASAFQRGLSQKGVTWVRPASVPSDAGDGFAYNAPWQMVTANGRPVSESAVLRLSAAMACVRLLSQTIASLPLGIYRRLPDGDRAPANDHPLYELLHNQPNADMTAADFWQVRIAAMLLRGNGLARKLRIGSRLVGLEPMHPDATTWYRRGTEIRYRYTDPNGKAFDLGREDVWHTPAFTLDGIFGISPIAYGAGVFGAAIAAEDASSGVFANGMAASGFVESQNWLTPEQRDSVRKHLGEFTYSSVNERKAFVLEGGMKYTPLTMNPEDSQLLETRAFNVEEVCRWFGLDPSLVGHGQKVSNYGTGLEEKNLGFLAYCLTPWLRKLEQSIRKDLIVPGEKNTVFAEFNVAGLLRGNAKARAEYYSQMVNNGLMTRDEVRRLENLPAMEGNAGVLTVQTALAPLDKLGEVQASPAQTEEQE